MIDKILKTLFGGFNIKGVDKRNSFTDSHSIKNTGDKATNFTGDVNSPITINYGNISNNDKK